MTEKNAKQSQFTMTEDRIQETEYRKYLKQSQSTGLRLEIRSIKLEIRNSSLRDKISNVKNPKFEKTNPISNWVKWRKFFEIKRL